MFEWLIICKEQVKITCGAHTLVGTISNYYKAFQLIKIQNVLIPIECIREIEVLESSASSTLHEPESTEDRRSNPIDLFAKRLART
ncbi:hypothetical protein GK047_19230 [Paenibacillus sp. SYP-B3998]|uniref:DUF2642 domain-containing protein n=1 Tax=Paenibacillus sp. SYP-B3998 TaxID=2678564 RepID=A0A6G4A0W9_9BACL|nr:hypothetical protein [Paenibacillus sp. SYP-B3998]NEW08136.1 hypothetical protein [Paenibacillus sp. SYP-B3998]